VIAALAACGGPNPDRPPAGRSDTRQQPSNYQPGVHVSGHVNVGVVRSF
jgi:hypothetical protein